MNTHRSKRECVVIMFYIVYYRLCFQHRLDNSVPCGQPLCVYNTNGLYSLQSVGRLSKTERVEQERKRLVQIFEVLTTAQGYLIHKTLFASITGANRLILVSCQSSLLNSLCSCFSSPVHSKDT